MTDEEFDAWGLRLAEAEYRVGLAHKKFIIFAAISGFAFVVVVGSFIAFFLFGGPWILLAFAAFTVQYLYRKLVLDPLNNDANKALDEVKYG